MIHHVQLACPPGSEDTLRGFYTGVRGLRELANRLCSQRGAAAGSVATGSSCTWA